MARRRPPTRRTRTSEVLSARSRLGPLYAVVGQAVIAVRAGATFESLSLEVVDAHRHAARIQGLRMKGEATLKSLYTLLAGPIAARMHSGLWIIGADDGPTRFARLLTGVPHGDPTKGTGRAWQALCAVEETAGELWECWPSVEHVAQELQARPRLDLAAVQALVIDAPKTRRPLVPAPDELLRHLDDILRRKHDINLGDWRTSPKFLPMPSATLRTSPATS